MTPRTEAEWLAWLAERGIPPSTDVAIVARDGFRRLARRRPARPTGGLVVLV